MPGVIAAAVGASTRALFFESSVSDFRVLSGALVLLAVAIVASAAPARRASRVDLVRVLTVD